MGAWGQGESHKSCGNDVIRPGAVSPHPFPLPLKPPRQFLSSACLPLNVKSAVLGFWLVWTVCEPSGTARPPSSSFLCAAPLGVVAEASEDAGLGDREDRRFLPPLLLPARLPHPLAPLASFICEAGVEGDRTSPRGANNRVIIQWDETELSGAS